MSNFLVRPKFPSFLQYILYLYTGILYLLYYSTLFIYVYIKVFLLCLIKTWERTSKKKDRDGEIGKHKLNEIALNVKQKKWNKLGKSIRSSYSPVVFKRGSSPETHLGLWRKASNTWAFVCFKKFQFTSDSHMDFKKRLQVFLLHGFLWYSFVDTESYYFPVDRWWDSGIKWVIVT